MKDSDGEVVGVTATIDGEDVNFGAEKAVILASGGMDWNTNLARAYSPQQLWELETGVCLCAEENTGDGMVMGMGVGADLAGLGGTIGYPSLRIGRNFPGIWVNRYGQRFVNEAGHYAYVMRAVFQQENHMAWGIFDDDVAALGGAQIGGWSEDLSEEIANGTIKTGETLEDLADELGVDATALQATVDRWNADMASTEDTLYGRTDALEPLETGPWYAARSTSTNLGSCGGLRIDTNARVMSLWGEPIPRLYAAGMVAGGFIGPYYPGSGTAILATVVFGRIAGQNAAATEAKRTRTEA
jgi:fumarate reductase flavoprotein subunit